METLRRLRFYSLPIPRTALLLIISGLLIMMTAACGKKGPVRPKLATLPAAPAEVTLQQQGPLFLLGWTIPSANQDGSKVQDLTGFRIKRLNYDAEQGCPTCREPQDQVAELDLQSPSPGQRVNKRMYWRDLDIQPGMGYRYAIVPLIVGGEEGPAATIHLATVSPPPPPTTLRAEAGDAQVSLEWQAPALAAGVELIGYNLYRSQANRPFPVVPVNSEPLSETRLLDRGLDSGRTYQYRVSALIRIGDQILESAASPMASASPR